MSGYNRRQLRHFNKGFFKAASGAGIERIRHCAAALRRF
jgi:hypothetical protein